MLYELFRKSPLDNAIGVPRRCPAGGHLSGRGRYAVIVEAEPMTDVKTPREGTALPKHLVRPTFVAPSTAPTVEEEAS